MPWSSCQTKDSPAGFSVTFWQKESLITLFSGSRMDTRFNAACQHFDAGEYFEAHEVWEDLWNEAYGPRHAYLQGLIQTAVALHHAGNENWNGTRKLLASAWNYLE